MAPPLWCEARCHYMSAGVTRTGSNACHQTAPGAFGNRWAVFVARKAGWHVVRDQWCCPACYPIEKTPKNGGPVK